MRYLLSMTIALFAFGAMAQGRNEYEKKLVEIHVARGLDTFLWVISDDSPKNRCDKLLYPNGKHVKSFAGLFGYMESLGSNQYNSTPLFYSATPTPTLFFIHKDDKEFSILGGKIFVKEVEDK
ncbi:MAG: hypothetical protein IH947_10195 [Bacteroidetes bacterium]|nr:hypothetical protein [Bacteroidota bacterium]